MSYVHMFLSGALGAIGLFTLYLAINGSINLITSIKRVLWLPPGYQVRGHTLGYVTGPKDMPVTFYGNVPHEYLTYFPHGHWFFQSWFACKRAINLLLLNTAMITITAIISLLSYQYVIWAWF